MSDIVPFRTGDFLGSLEVQGKFVTISKQLRLKRLKEVREQERLIAQKRCATYRQCIDGRKSVKTDVIKDERRNEKLCELNDLKRKADAASEESGLAHRLARSKSETVMKRMVENSKIEVRRAKEQHERHRIARKVLHADVLATQSETLRQQTLHKIKKEFRQSEREDAHAIGETYAARQQILDAQRVALFNLHSVPPVYTHRRVQQGAVSIEQRFPVEVHARIVRHGVRAHDSTVVHNGAIVEEVAILRKNWQAVMREMTTRLRVRVRAKAAEQTVERKKGIQFLDSELHQLEVVDKSHGRMSRLNSAVGVLPDAEAPRLQSSFEHVFLNKPVRLDAQQAVYRTGSHLVEAAFDQRAELSERALDFDLGVGVGGRHPHWTSAPPEPSLRNNRFLVRPQPSMSLHHSYADDVSRSSASSSDQSEEVRVLYSRRMYEGLQGATAQDVPHISRAPPTFKFSVQCAPDSPESVAAPHPGTPEAMGGQASSRPAVRRGDNQSNPALATSPERAGPAGLQVRVPQVGGTLPAADFSPGMRSQMSASTASSSESSVPKNVNLSSDASFGEEDGPLSIQIRSATSPGALQLSGSVTPPRHCSSRPGGRGERGIDPFTPPEVHEARPVPQRPYPFAHRLDVAGSPVSMASSSNTEHARHDRSPAQSPTAPLDLPRPAQSLLGDSSVVSSSNCSSSHSRGSGSGSTASSADAYGKEFSDQLSRDIAELESSFDSVNMSALTELGATAVGKDTKLENQVDVPSSSGRSAIFSTPPTSRSSSACDGESSAGSDRLSGSHRNHLSSSSASKAGSQSLMSGNGSNSHSSAPRNSSQPPVAQASGASSSRSTSSSTSSSSMLSYLQSSPFVVPRPPQSATSPAAGTEAARSFSFAQQSLESDSISVLSTNSAEGRSPASTAHRYVDSSVAATSALTRQQVQEVLRDLSDASDNASERSSPVEAPRGPGHNASPARKATAGPEEKLSPYDAMYDSWGEEQHLSVRISAPAAAPRSLRGLPVPEEQEEEEEEDQDSDEEYDREAEAVAARIYERRGVNGTASTGSDRDESVGGGSGESSQDVDSKHSETTNELFEKWQALYQGSVTLGDRARTARTEHVAAYTANTSTSLAEDTSFLSDVSLPAPEHALNSPVRPAAKSGSATGDSVPASPLDVFAANSSPAPYRPAPHDDDFGNLRGYGKFPRGSLRSSEDSGPSVGSRGSLSSDSLAPRPLSPPLRESYDFSHAESVMSALDKLSEEWGVRVGAPADVRSADPSKQAGGAVGSAVASTPAPAFASAQTSTVSARPAPRPYTAAGPVGDRHGSTVSVSSLSGAATPPEQSEHSRRLPATAGTIVESETPQLNYSIRNTYAGRLVVHREQRPLARSQLTAQLGLDDSLLDSSDNSNSGSVDYRGPQDPRALLSSDDEGEGDDPSLEELLRGPYTSAHSQGALRSEFSGLLERMRDAPVPAPVPAAAPPSAPVLSSGEDTYSSGRYYSAGEAHNTSSSTMHTAASSEHVSAGQARSATTTSNTVRRVSTATSSLTVHTTHRTVTTTSSSRGLLPSEVPDSSNIGTPQRVGAESLTSLTPDLDVTPSSDAFSSPSANSGSRLSEYAMFSQYTMSASRTRSPSAESPRHTFPQPQRGLSLEEARMKSALPPSSR